MNKKRKEKNKKKKILEINRKVKKELKSFEHKMSKRKELMKKLVNVKHKVDKTKPFKVSTKKISFKDTEEELINEFVLNNKEIKKITEQLKKERIKNNRSLNSANNINFRGK